LVARGLPVPEERIQPQLATINQRRRLSIDATGTQAAVAAQKRAIGEAACDF